MTDTHQADPLTLPAGLELNARVAREVFGLNVVRDRLYVKKDGDEEPAWIIVPDGPRELWLDLPHYSTDWAAAGLVVEKLREQGFEFYLEQRLDPVARVAFRQHAGPPNSAHGDTIPLAICRAALVAILYVTTLQSIGYRKMKD